MAKTPPWRYKRSTESDLARGLMRLTKLVERICAAGKSVASITAAISEITNTPAWRRYAMNEAYKMVGDINRHNAHTWRHVAKSKTHSRRIYQILSQGLRNNQAFQKQIAANAQYFLDLPDSVAKDITKHVSTQAVRGLRAEALLSDIRKIAPGMSNARANLIARTETAKAQAAITQIQAQEIGIDWYVWETAQDGPRVRKAHQLMQGVLCRYSSPPSPEALVGIQSTLGCYNAGNCPNCRCYSSPLVNLSDVSWPCRVFYDGRIVRMTQKKFVELFGYDPEGW